MINDCPVPWHRFSSGLGGPENASLILAGFKLIHGAIIGITRTGSFGRVSKKRDREEKNGSSLLPAIAMRIWTCARKCKDPVAGPVFIYDTDGITPYTSPAGPASIRNV